jgi:hypothetical protein
LKNAENNKKCRQLSAVAAGDSRQGHKKEIPAFDIGLYLEFTEPVADDACCFRCIFIYIQKQDREFPNLPDNWTNILRIF